MTREDGKSPTRDVRSDSPRGRRTILIVVTAALGLLLAAGGYVLLPVRSAFYTDADTIREPHATAQLREILWQPPTHLPLPIDGDTETYEPRLSADGLTLYFVRGKAGDNADIFFCRRTTSGWNAPEPLADVNSEYDDLGPEPSADGNTLYFYSNRPGGSGGYDLWMVRRAADGRSGFGGAINLGPAVNSEFNEYGPALTPDGKTLYFSSNRPAVDDPAQPDPHAWPGTLREDLYRRTYDLYRSAVSDGGFGRAAPLTALNTSHNEGAPAVSNAGDFLYFSSDRPGGFGGYDLYRSRCLKDVLLRPENLGAAVNTSANELDPGMSLGGFALHFSSDRAGDRVDPDRRHPYQLYQTASREVFREVESHPRAIAWAAIWSAVGRNLLWALLALLLLLLMLALLRDLRQRKLSLLARCLLASLAAHLLLMLLLNVWEVGAAMAGEFRQRGVIRVALSEGGADPSAAAALIRGAFTEVEVAAPSIATERTTAALPVVVSRPVVHMAPAQRSQPGEAPLLPDVPRDARTPPSELAEGAGLVPVEWTPSHLALESPESPLQVRETEATPDMPRVAAPSEVRRSVSELAELPISAPASPDIRIDLPRTNPGMLDLGNQASNTPSVADAPTPATLASYPTAANPPPVISAPMDVSRPVAEMSADRIVEELELRPAATPVGTVPARPFQESFPTVATDLRVESSPPPVSWVRDSDAAAARWAEMRLADARPSENQSVVATAPVEVVLGDASSWSLALPDDADASRTHATEMDTAPHSALVALENLRIEPVPPVAIEVPGDLMAQQPVPPVPAVSLEALTAGGPVASATPRDVHVRPTVDVPADWTVRAMIPDESPLWELNLPEEAAPPVEVYAQRSESRRMDAVQAHGGSEETEQAVARALAWLARHQSADGRWDGDGFDRHCGQCAGETSVEVDAALTGLSLLCFLAADHTHVKDGPYRVTVERGLRWLTLRQQSDGDLRGPETMYSHGIATIALSEALGMTGDPNLREPVQEAIRFIEGARNRHEGGWRYDPGQPGDTSVLGWQVMALKSARLAGAEVSLDAFRAAGQWLERVSDARSRGRYAYQPGRPVTPSMTAEGLFIQQLLGRHHDHPHSLDAAGYVSDHPPDWSAGANTYYWYYATLALFQQQGEAWRAWNERLTSELLAHQRKDAAAAGSWDPVGEWAPIGGRVYQTAICTLMLEVYYRYLPLYGETRPYDAIGTIRGRVSDAVTGLPLAGAVVRLNLSDRPALTATANAEGFYGLDAPRVPDFVALSASREGYLPASANVASARLEGAVLTVDFTLTPENQAVVALEAVPEVHHLGDDQFGGAINSQFQKQSEGEEFATTFHLSADQLRPNGTAEIRLLAKGVQVPHRLYINGTLLDRRLERSPGDGSFGEFRAAFNAGLLREGENEFRILAGRRGNDVDDFEFVNVQIHLRPELPPEPSVAPLQAGRLPAVGGG